MPSDQLTNVVSAFARWRSNKKGMNTPNALREQAVALKSSYSASIITKALSVSGGQFKKWCQDIEAVGQPVFVNLPEPIITPTSPSKWAGSSKVEVHFTSGERLCLQGGDNAMLLCLVKALKS